MSRAVEGDPKIDEVALEFANALEKLRSEIGKAFPDPHVLARNLDSKTLRKVTLEFKWMSGLLQIYSANLDNYHSVRIEQSAKSQLNKLKKQLKKAARFLWATLKCQAQHLLSAQSIAM